MNQCSEQTFAALSISPARTQRRAQDPFVSRNRAFDLPALSINAVVKASPHLCSILPFGPLFKPRARIEFDDSRTYSMCLPTQAVVVFSIVSTVAENTIQRDHAASHVHGRREVRRILAGTFAGRRTHDQVRARQYNKRQFGPDMMNERTRIGAARFKMAADMASFQSGGIDGRFRARLDQSAFASSIQLGAKEALKIRFFNKRASAF